MVRALRARRGTRGAVATALAVALAAGGCGSDELAAGDEAAPAITVSAVIAPRGVAVSPSRFAAGTIELLASNQTPRSQRLELRSRRLASGGRLLAQRTGPINPGGTTTLKVELAEGSYVVSARGSAIEPAAIAVLAPRAGSGDRLLAP